LKAFVPSPKFIGLVITEFNGARDAEGNYAERLGNAAAKALEDG
jgi:hypothetical protein